jgi:hypothetical protein
MNYSSTISLAVKVIYNDIFEGMGKVGDDGHANGCEISVHCLGTDEGGKLFNVVIRTSSDTYEEALKIVEDLSCNSIHYIKGIFFLDSNEKLDLITVFNPTYEPISNETMTFYSKIFNIHNPEKGKYLYRSVANDLTLKN